MLHCISVENMRESDRKTIEGHVPSLTLMYRAAIGVYRAADWPGETVIAVGSGNNGGDGFALACILRERGHACRVLSLSEKRSPDSAYYEKQALALGVSVRPWTPGAFAGATTIVDCLLGTGFSGALRDPWRAAAEEINASPARVLSVDIPSGMNGDTGEAVTAVRSDLTVTIGYVKIGLVTPEAGRYIRRLVCADIGILLDREEWLLCAPEEADGERRIPAPPWLETEPIDVRDAEP